MKNKIVFTILALAVFGSTLLTAAYLKKSRDIAKEMSSRELATQADLIIAYFEQHLDSVYIDLAVLTHEANEALAVEEHIARLDAETQGGFSSVTLSALANNFKRVALERPYYTQIRLIGVENGGREIARLNITPDSMSHTPESALQDKSKEPYFIEAVAQFQDEDHDHDHGHAEDDTTDEHAHDVYYSKVTLNRENGIIAEPKVATLRMITPVYRDAGELFAVLVINLDFEKFAAHALEAIPNNNETLIATESLDYISFEKNSGTTRLEFHESYSKPLSNAVVEALKKPDHELIEFGSKVAVSARLSVNDSPDRFFAAIVVADQVLVREKIKELGLFGVEIGLVMVMITALVALALARYLTDPLERLSAAVTEAEKTGKPIAFNYVKEDEIGLLNVALRRLSQSLRESEEVTRAILNSAGEGIVAVRQDGEIADTNAAFDEIFGYEHDELKGKNVQILMPPLEGISFEWYLQRWIEHGKDARPLSDEAEYGRKKDGWLFPIETTVTQLTTRREVLYIGVVRDITETVALDKAKSDFIAKVSHELRTPLTNMIGYVSFLSSPEFLPSSKALSKELEGDAQKDKARQEFVAEISQMAQRAKIAGDHLRTLINNILDFSKLDAHKMQLDIDELEVEPLVQGVLVQFEGVLKEKGLNSECVVEIDQVFADEMRLRQILINLVGNALKFTETGGIVVAARSNGDFIEFRVTDTGGGISEEAQSHLFDLFTQADSSATRRAGGTGLGLTIAKQLVELHGGAIGVESVPGEGSTFWFTIPRKPKVASAAPEAE